MPSTATRLAGAPRPTAFPLAGVVASAARDLWRYQARTLFRGPSTPLAVAILQRWSARACAHLGLDVAVHGTPAAMPCIYVANHRSYLDIPLLASVLGAAFMSRADVAGWPIVGPAARAVGCVFVERDDPSGRVRAARALARRLRAGSVVVFPEGTTGGERLPGAFHAGLFRLLHRLRVPVVPVTIRYGDRRAYWVDDVGLLRHLRTRVLAADGIAAAVHVGGPLDARLHPDGPSLARAAHTAAGRALEELGELA
jgi:1-acyl-sn-glycerol-3-phosphate acyltransferase